MLNKVNPQDASQCHIEATTMNIQAKTRTPLINNDTILALCLEDQSCFVDENNVVYTCNPDSENFQRIVSKMKILLQGREPEIRLSNREEVLSALQAGSTLASEPGYNHKKAATAVSTQVEERLMGLLAKCIRMRGSDIHILVKGGKSKIQVRVDGRLVELSALQSKEYGAELTAYIFQALGNSEENYSPLVPNAGGFSKLINVGSKLRMWDWRSSLIPVSGISADDTDCTKTVLRLLTSIDDKIPSFADMGMDEEHIEILERAIRQPQGAVVLSGPTGSGKTTNAMSALSIVDPERNINTLEDPPEWSLNGVAQTRIDYGKTKNGITRDFTYYAKTMLRQDPDVIYFGEVRDQKSAAEFTHLSESGHLLIGTTHTSSATGIATKLVEHLRVPGVIASSPDVFSVFAHQRLIRKLCPHCSIPYEKASKDQKALLDRVLEHKTENARVKNPEGCNECTMGEKGRTIVMEVIELTDEDRAFVATGNALAWKKHLLENGWRSIQYYALKKVSAGICDINSAAEQVKGLI